MKKFLILFLVIFIVFSCKKEEEEEEPPSIDNTDIIGTWKRINLVSINGTDSSFNTYSENIYHYYNSDGTYDETKSGSSIYTSNANYYQFDFISDTLKFYSMGYFSHAYPAKITGSTMIIDVGSESGTKYSYKLTKE